MDSTSFLALAAHQQAEWLQKQLQEAPPKLVAEVLTALQPRRAATGGPSGTGVHPTSSKRLLAPQHQQKKTDGEEYANIVWLFGYG